MVLTATVFASSWSSLFSTFFFAISDTVTFLIAESTNHLCTLKLVLLLWAILSNMTCVVAITADWDTSLHRNTNVFQSLEIVGRVLGPKWHQNWSWA